MNLIASKFALNKNMNLIAFKFTTRNPGEDTHFSGLRFISSHQANSSYNSVGLAPSSGHVLNFFCSWLTKSWKCILLDLPHKASSFFNISNGRIRFNTWCFCKRWLSWQKKIILLYKVMKPFFFVLNGSNAKLIPD